jgi:hypothetical protein
MRIALCVSVGLASLWVASAASAEQAEAANAATPDTAASGEKTNYADKIGPALNTNCLLLQ